MIKAVTVEKVDGVAYHVPKNAGPAEGGSGFHVSQYQVRCGDENR